MEERSSRKNTQNSMFWTWALISVAARVLLIYFPGSRMLSSRPEISNPLTSLRRLTEGYWLKLSAMSPYAGSMYHASPLLLSVLGPLTVKRNEGHPNHVLCRLLFVIADFITSVLIRSTGQKLQMSYTQSLLSLDNLSLLSYSDAFYSGDISALVYLWNPLSIAACVGSSTSPLENLVAVFSLYGAITGLVPLASFGWVIATHLSLYPAILFIPIILLLGHGPDTPPAKLYMQKKVGCGEHLSSGTQHLQGSRHTFSWRHVIHFLFWSSFWASCVVVLCRISVGPHGGLGEMFKSTYGFILTVEDLSPNIGMMWYFFAEVFEFFRNFFVIVFHINILFMILPLAMRMYHRPLFMAFVYITICSMFKAYPSVGDPALYLGLLCLFLNELSDMHFSFFLFCGYVGVFLLSPTMHNLWIWRGTGNANFYFATAMIYACLQIILLVESISAMLNHDRKLVKLFASKT